MLSHTALHDFFQSMFEVRSLSGMDVWIDCFLESLVEAPLTRYQDSRCTVGMSECLVSLRAANCRQETAAIGATDVLIQQ